MAVQANMPSTIINTLMLLLFLPIAIALPIATYTDVPPIAANTASCTTTFESSAHGGAALSYALHIGRPFISGAGCPSIHHLLSTNATIANFSCIDDGAGQTNLTFLTPTDLDTNQNVIYSLQLAYPMIPFEKDGICDMKDSDLEKRSKALEENTAKCGSWKEYMSNSAQTKLIVKIGRPYLGGVNCAGVLELIRSKFYVDEITCQGIHHDRDTKLEVFAGVNTRDLEAVNEGLGAAYPMVEEFDCPGEYSGWE